MTYEFTCTACGWEGTQPTFDAHLNAWCPTCGKPAEFSEIVRMRRSRKDDA